MSFFPLRIGLYNLKLRVYISQFTIKKNKNKNKNSNWNKSQSLYLEILTLFLKIATLYPTILRNEVRIFEKKNQNKSQFISHNSDFFFSELCDIISWLLLIKSNSEEKKTIPQNY